MSNNTDMEIEKSKSNDDGGVDGHAKADSNVLCKEGVKKRERLAEDGRPNSPCYQVGIESDPSSSNDQPVGISHVKHLGGFAAAANGYDTHKDKGHSIALQEAVCHYNEFVERVPEREVGSGWQPIRNAPKDRVFLGVIEYAPGQFGEPFIAHWDEGMFCCKYFTEAAPHKPTHWAELPEIPRRGSDA